MTLAMIMNIVEYLMVGAVLAMMGYPYIAHYFSEKTLKGSMYENGVGYVEAFYQSCKHRFGEFFGTIALLFLLCVFSSKFALAMSIYFLHVMIVGRIAIKRGHIPGSVEWG